MSQRRTIIITTIFAAVAIVGFIGYQIYQAVDRSQKIPIEIAAVPSDAKITLKNAATDIEYSSHNGTTYVPAGNYIITATKDGFINYRVDIDAKQKPSQTVIIELTPRSAEAKKWQREHIDQYDKVESIAGKQAIEAGNKFINKYPIVAKLPIKTAYYSIGYYKREDRPVLVVRTESPQYRYKAVAKLVASGVRLSDYQIEFANYKNPLGE